MTRAKTRDRVLRRARQRHRGPREFTPDYGDGIPGTVIDVRSGGPFPGEGIHEVIPDHLVRVRWDPPVNRLEILTNGEVEVVT